MTALAMVIGMLPMSLGLGEGGEQNAPPWAGRLWSLGACLWRRLPRCFLSRWFSAWCIVTNRTPLLIQRAKPDLQPVFIITLMNSLEPKNLFHT